MLRQLAKIGVGTIVTLAGCIDSPDLVTAAPGPDSPPPSGEQTTSTPSTDATDAAQQGDGAASIESDASDAAPPVVIDPVKAQACADAKGSFDGTKCVIACTLAAKCGDRRCPAGMPCEVTCIGEKTCKKVECGSATSCSVRCEGLQACDGDVKSIDLASTAIVCDGTQACNGKVFCSGVACALTCANDGCKAGEVSCCATTCTLNGSVGTCL
jgi:hypothetical protein